MNRIYVFSFTFLLFLVPFWAGAQDSKAIDKALNKSLKSTKKSPISVPGLGAVGAAAGGTADLLSKAVGGAVGGGLKVAKKAALFSTKGLGPVQLGKIATSGSPFTTLLEIKGKNARKQFEGIIGDQLEKTGALGMLDKAEGLTGFDLPGGGKDKNKFISKVTDNTIGELDKAGAGMMKKLL
jgi:hypothetical protein